VLAALIGNQFLFKVFDLSSVDSVYVGAGTVSGELHTKTKAAQPNWNLVTGYGRLCPFFCTHDSSADKPFKLGLTESPAAVAMSSPHEYLPGSVGVLLPLYQARLVREDGSEVDQYGEPGELLLSSPNQAAGYHGDDEGSAATFRDDWLHTGDIALFRQSPGKGDAHLFIVDRLRDMIKVKVRRPDAANARCPSA
jgi:acyl-CoA synthetase (AMP-forming)/AMP-acid ligase II